MIEFQRFLSKNLIFTRVASQTKKHWLFRNSDVDTRWYILEHHPFEEVDQFKRRII